MNPMNLTGDVRMGFLNNITTAFRQPGAYAIYDSCHLNVAGTDLKGTIALVEDKMIFYKFAVFGGRNEKNVLFELPYQKIISIGGYGSSLVVTALGQDKNGDNWEVPIRLTITKNATYNEYDKAKCNKLKE
jgi:hypothetical protein